RLVINVSSVAWGQWQATFMKRYLEDDPRRASLVAACGSGKTTLAASLAMEMAGRERGLAIILMAGFKAVADYLSQSVASQGLRVTRSIDALQAGSADVACLTTGQLDVSGVHEAMSRLSSRKNLFV